MEAKTPFTGEAVEDCDCCRIVAEPLLESYGCKERKIVFTPREQDVLRRIREASERARKIKAELRAQDEAGTVDGSVKRRALEELEVLRRTRAELEEERLAAADERMRLLGHL